jgi:GT2 family glycosyltransferase
MSDPQNHINVCVCTYKRPALLSRLLGEIASQETRSIFTISVIVVDNDALMSGHDVVLEHARRAPIPICYRVEPMQNIARARNKAVSSLTGNYVAFIDDDEFPAPNWLLTLYEACQRYGVDGVLGPVKRHFDEEPPRWLLNSHFYDRRVNPTGMIVEWQEARTGNVLLKSGLFDASEAPFREEFRAGEDQDFFRRMMQKGYRFVWCADAIVYEVVPSARWRRSYMLRKALLRGATARLQPNCGIASILKSAVAVVVYFIALPFALLVGHHRFMEILVSLFDHLGKLLAVVGLNPIKEQYVSESVS